MVPGFDVESLKVLGRLIGGLERFALENAVPEQFDPADLFDEGDQTFFLIQGMADFWSRQNGVDFWQHMVDLVIGAHSQRQADLTMVMLGTPRMLSVLISLGSEKATRTILEGIFPGIRLQSVTSEELALTLSSHFAVQGVITGIPSRKITGAEGRDEQQEQNQMARSMGGQSRSQLERIVRGMHGATWAYMVQAHPRPRNKVVEERMKTVDLLTQVTSRSRAQWQSTRQGSLQTTTIESESQTQTYSGDMVNYRAQYLIKLLEHELMRLDQAAAAGQWTVRAYFGADNADDAHRLASLLLGTLGGAESRPEPLRALFCQPHGQSLEAFHTFLTSHEIASLIQFPREEVPGYAIHDHVLFDVDFQVPDEQTLPLGFIQQNGKDTANTYNISLDALTKHAVVIGVTGSGKTTTVMNLLDQVVEARKPFLVIEPAKTEYRSLHSVFARRANVRIYTLGNEMVAPFRLNPFEFETGNEPGEVSVLTHIDFLKAVFNAAFPLYAPMPQVLEEALHEVYEDKGWDLTSGINRRLPDWSERHLYPIFPTLTDLYYKVEEVTNRLGYDDEVESNVKAGLKARIGSLRIGSKGLMLDTARGMPMEQLFATPTILELENIGNDDEKTFLMGLLLARLYEFRRVQVATGRVPGGLQHLMVFEEAHRLLQNTSTQVDTESSNMRAQAIEVFTNMLSEVRAYGQGVLVAEQIPSKLAPDVLKNTNLKIVHRLIAQDDRQSIGQTMNLSADQQMHLGILTPGMAAVYAEGADHAYLVRMENYKRKIQPLPDKALKRISNDYASVRPFQAILDIDTYDVPRSAFGGPDPWMYQAAGKLLDSEKSKSLWANIILRLVSNPSAVFQVLLRISSYIESEMAHISREEHYTVMRMMLVRGSAELMHARGAQFGWTYAQAEELRVLLTNGLLGLSRAYYFARIAGRAEPDDEGRWDTPIERALDKASEQLAEFMSRYELLMQRGQGPFVGCTNCPLKCLFRSEVNVLLSEKNREWLNNELNSEGYETEEEQYEAAADAATHIVQSWQSYDLDAEPTERTPMISYCATLHVIAQAGYSEYEQSMMSEPISEILFSVGQEEDEQEDEYEYEEE
jgi:hypothetical protein